MMMMMMMMIIMIIIIIIIHFNICKEIGGGVKIDNEHWYDHIPKAVETILPSKITILWNQ